MECPEDSGMATSRTECHGAGTTVHVYVCMCVSMWVYVCVVCVRVELSSFPLYLHTPAATINHLPTLTRSRHETALNPFLRSFVYSAMP